MQLNKYLSAAMIASRRNAAVLIAAGRVTVNGAVITAPGYAVAASDAVAFDGAPVAPPPTEHCYIMLNKPRGYTSSHHDAHADKLAVTLITLPEARRLVAAGRLDKASEGMMIFSDDGDFINRLAHPRYEVLKRYRVTPSRPATAAELAKLRAGIVDDGETLRPHAVRDCGDGQLEFVLNEGKKREIRRLLAACGLGTLRLVRVATGTLELGTLGVGQWRFLTPDEVNQLDKCARNSFQ